MSLTIIPSIFVIVIPSIVFSMVKSKSKSSIKSQAAKWTRILTPIIFTLIRSLDQVKKPKAKPKSNRKPKSLTPPTDVSEASSSQKIPRFTGNKDISSLNQWFLLMEEFFENLNCPTESKVPIAVEGLRKRALDWWKAKEDMQEPGATYSLSWKDLQNLMTTELYPVIKKRKRSQKAEPTHSFDKPEPSDHPRSEESEVISPIPLRIMRPYHGHHQLCNLCDYHHSPQNPCRYCQRCNSLGHDINYCRYVQPNPRNH